MMKIQVRKPTIGIALTILMLLFFVTTLSGNSFAQTADFPKKEITILINFGPGGARDIIGRGWET